VSGNLTSIMSFGLNSYKKQNCYTKDIELPVSIIDNKKSDGYVKTNQTVQYYNHFIDYNKGCSSYLDKSLRDSELSK